MKPTVYESIVNWGKYCVNCWTPIVIRDNRVCDPCCKNCADAIFTPTTK